MGREGDSFGWAFAHLTLHRPFLQMFGSLKELTPLQLSMSGLHPLWRRRLKRRALYELQTTLKGASAWGRSLLTSLRRIRRNFFRVERDVPNVASMEGESRVEREVGRLRPHRSSPCASPPCATPPSAELLQICSFAHYAISHRLCRCLFGRDSRLSVRPRQSEPL